MKGFLALLIGFIALPLWADQGLPRFAPSAPKAAPDRTLKLLPWPAGQGPRAPRGYRVSVFAEIKNPRSILVLPSGDVLVAQTQRSSDDPEDYSSNQITKFETDDRGNVIATEVFLEKVDLPYGMAVSGDSFFVATPGQVLRYPMRNETLVGPGVQIASFPFLGPRRQWSRNLLISPDQSKILVSVGSDSEETKDFTQDSTPTSIVEMNLDGSNRREFAKGFGQITALAMEPTTQALWASVTQKGEPRKNYTPDYLLDVTTGFNAAKPFSMPLAFWDFGGGKPEKQKLHLDIFRGFKMDSQLVSSGLVFTEGSHLGADFEHGAFVAQYGSSNLAKPVNYKVLYLPFEDGGVSGPEEDFLTGFVADQEKGWIYGRPVMVSILNDDQVLVVDDVGDRIWRIQKH